MDSHSRHRSEKAGRREAVFAVAVTIAATVAVLVLRPSPAAPACPLGDRPLKIVAAPEIASSVAAVARAAEGGSGHCAAAIVHAEAPSVTARALATNETDRPDVWIPDSSYWTTQPGVPTGNPSIASSPYVLAVPERSAVRVGDLLPGPGKSDAPVRWALPQPGESVSTMAALVALQDTVANRSDRGSVLTTVIRSSNHDLPVGLASALSDAGSEPTAIPTTEQQALAYRSTHSASPLSIVYEGEQAGAADYPYVVFAADRARRLAATDLLKALTGDLGRRILGARGFRDAQGAPGPVLSASYGVDRQTLSYRAPSDTAIQDSLRVEAAIGQSSRLLAVVDVSGSMASVVPGTGGATRLDLALRALTTGLAVYQDDNVAGLWTFSTSLTPTTDFRELVPPVLLGVTPDGASGRAMLARALAGVRVKPDGGTGLYDTTLAAVRRLQRDWDPHRVNSVVLITDGANDDPHGIDLHTLLSALEAERDGSRPVAVDAVGYGATADMPTLRRIAAATGGVAYAATDPRTIGSVIASSIGRRR